MADYFELWDDMEVPGRWLLGDTYIHGRWVNPDIYTGAGGPKTPEGPIVVEVDMQGRALDYTMAGRGMPVASQRAAELFARVAPGDVQVIPVTVDGRSEPYFILHALHAIECVDEARSRGIRRWTEEDGRPDRIGEYHGFDALAIDPSRVAGHHFFRVARWLVSLIVSDHLRRELERANLTGLLFHPL